MGELTKIRFAQLCGYIAKNAANWSSEALDFVDRLDDPERSEAVFRFTDEMRQRLDRIDSLAGRQALRPTTSSNGGDNA